MHQAGHPAAWRPGRDLGSGAHLPAGSRTWGRGMMQAPTWEMLPGPTCRRVTGLETVNVFGCIWLRAGDAKDPPSLEERSEEMLPRWQPEGCSHGAQKMHAS